MKIIKLYITVFFLGVVSVSIAQSPAGTWSGTSICQIRDSPCHDEKVKYYISKKGAGERYEVVMYKIVENREDSMGMQLFTLDEKKKMLFYIDSARNAKWEFNISGNEIKGILLYNDKLYRIVEMKRESQRR